MSFGKSPLQAAGPVEKWPGRKSRPPGRGSDWIRGSRAAAARGTTQPCQHIDIARKKDPGGAPRNGDCARMWVVGRKSNDRRFNPRRRRRTPPGTIPRATAAACGLARGDRAPRAAPSSACRGLLRAGGKKGAVLPGRRQAAIAFCKFSSILSRKPAVDSQGWSAPIRSARSLVM